MVQVDFTIVMQWINFLILVTLLYAFLYKPLLSFLDKRSKSISENIEEALNNKEKSLKTLGEYEEKIKGIESEADRIFGEAKRRAEKEKDRIMDSANTEAKNIIQGAREDIEREVEKARQQLKGDISSLVVSCSSKVLEREISEKDHKKFINDFLQS